MEVSAMEASATVESEVNVAHTHSHLHETEVVNCNIGNWIDSGSCVVAESANCDYITSTKSGTQLQTRTVNDVNGGSDCGSTSQSRSCEVSCTPTP